jgi:Flp pilus assembly protein CpaB
LSRPRGRALLFAALAALSALGSMAIASRYRDGVAQGYGDQRSVLVVERELRAGVRLDPGRVEKALASRDVPERFIPPDALALPAEAIGARPRVAVPAGSYLLRSQLIAVERPDRGSTLREGLRPVEVAVASAAGLGGRGGARRVDVIAADEPGATLKPRVRVLAEAVPLLEIKRAAGAEPGEPAWVATLGLGRSTALAVIEAENFARQIRLLPH